MFQELDVKIIKVNPSHIKFQDQYVECCCSEHVRSEVVRKLKAIDGIFDVGLMNKDEGNKNIIIKKNFIWTS